jgi:hypothetical protein
VKRNLQETTSKILKGKSYDSRLGTKLTRLKKPPRVKVPYGGFFIWYKLPKNPGYTTVERREI